MPLLGRRLYLALDASAVTVATLGDGLGRRRARAFARAPLGPGALTPSPSGPNLQRGDEVRAAVRRALEEAGGGRATLVLPDGIARIALVEVPKGADPRDYVRFRLAASLPWPASEAIVEALPAGRGRVVGAAVRRATVAEYEQAAAAAGLEVDRVHLAPLLALEGLMRAGAREATHVVLGEVAFCLAPFRGGLPVALRCRRRDRSAGEASRLREEASRVAAVAGNGAGPATIVLSGVDAPGCAASSAATSLGAGSRSRASGPTRPTPHGSGGSSREPPARLLDRSPPGPARVWGTLAVAAGLLAAILAAAEAWRARDEARRVGARVADLRREVTAASARVRALEARVLGAAGRGFPRRRRRPRGRRGDLLGAPGRRAARAPVDRLCPRRGPRDARGRARRASVGSAGRGAGGGARPARRRARAGGADAEVRSVVKARWAGDAP